jgi:hypothetical protein
MRLELGVTTVSTPEKIVSRKDQKQIVKLFSLKPSLSLRLINYAYNLHSFAIINCFRRKRGVGDGCLCSFKLRQYYSTLFCLSSVNNIIFNKVICLFVLFQSEF